MNQPTVPLLSVSRHTGWSDEDFYKLKLVLDRVDNIGFWFYLRHPKQALRDFRLHLKFGKTAPQKPRARPKLKFGKKDRGIECKEVKKVVDPADAKMKKTLDLALFMQANGVVAPGKEALDAQVDVMLKYTNDELVSYELVTRKMVEDLKKKK